LDAARQAERVTRDDWRKAQHAIAAAQAGLDKAQRAVGDLVTRRTTLEETHARLAADLAEAVGAEAEAETALAQAGDESAIAAAAEEAQHRLTGLRDKADQSRARLANL